MHLNWLIVEGLRICLRLLRNSVGDIDRSISTLVVIKNVSRDITQTVNADIPTRGTRMYKNDTYMAKIAVSSEHLLVPH